MSRYRFELATAADDADLRHVLASTPMPGHMSVSFQREPSWFAAAVVDGFERQVVACRDLDAGRIFGFGCRSLRELYVNGRPTTVGYLSSLRILPEYRNLGLVARGYAFFRKLHQDGRTPFYLTTIAAGNDTAIKILTSGRAGLPSYHPAGRYHTLAIALPRRVQRPALNFGVKIRPASAADVPALCELLATAGSRRQFFPQYRREELLAPAGLLRGLTLDRVLLAERGGHILGMIAAWDQLAYRQQIVHSYGGWVRWLRPLYNVGAWLRGRSGLPAAGCPLRTLNIAVPVVLHDDPLVFDALLAALRGHCGGEAWTHLLLGLHERDPLLATARRYESACYTALLYIVCWPDGESVRAALQDLPPYLELGSL